MGNAKRFRRHHLRSERMIQRRNATPPTDEMPLPQGYTEDDLVIKKFCYLCPEDSAGVRYKDGRCQCMCLHYEQEPLIKGRPCRRRTVTRAPKSPGIPVDVVSDKRNTSTSFGDHSSLGATTNITDNTFQIALILTLVVLSFLILLLVGLCFLRRRSFKCLGHFSQPIRLELKAASTSVRLLPDRLIENPTYESTCLDLAIPIYPAEEITLTNQIGQGCFGKVFKGQLKNGQTVAVKIVKQEHATEAVREVETMSCFSHPNILSLLGIAKSTDTTESSPWLLFEYMRHGDLANVLRKSSFRPEGSPAPPPPLFGNPVEEIEKDYNAVPQFQLTPDLLPTVAMQIAEGMRYLSTQHFVHRDLAARNCLVSATGVVKISDFGLSRDVYTCDYYKIGGSKLLPIRWMPPESILYGCFTLESDVWAYGTLLWEIYTWGKQPYYGHSNEEVVQLILDGVLLSPPGDCPPLIQEIMAGCWKTEAEDRLTFSQIYDKFVKAGCRTCKVKNHGVPIPGKKLKGISAFPVESEYEIPRAAVLNQVEYLQVV